MYELQIMELYKFYLDNAVLLNLCFSGDNCVLWSIGKRRGNWNIGGDRSFV